MSFKFSLMVVLTFVVGGVMDGETSKHHWSSTRPYWNRTTTDSYGHGDECTTRWLYGSSSNKIISSPNYPQNYGNNQCIIWYISIDGYQRKVKLDILSKFKTERDFDFLDVFYGHSTDDINKLIRLTGSYDRVATIFAPTQRLTLKFKSDSSNTNTGFQARFSSYTADRMSNELDMSGDTGVLVSPRYGSRWVSSQHNFLYHIRTLSTYNQPQVSLKFLNLSIAHDETVTVYDGYISLSDILDPPENIPYTKTYTKMTEYNWEWLDQLFISTGSVVSVKFMPSLDGGIHHSSGFRATFHTVFGDSPTGWNNYKFPYDDFNAARIGNLAVVILLIAAVGVCCGICCCIWRCRPAPRPPHPPPGIATVHGFINPSVPHQHCQHHEYGNNLPTVFPTFDKVPIVTAEERPAEEN